MKRAKRPKTEQINIKDLRVGMMTFISSTKDERSYQRCTSIKWRKDVKRFEVGWFVKADGGVASTYPANATFDLVVEDETEESNTHEAAT